MRHFVVLVNPAAGSAPGGEDGDGRDPVLDAVLAELARHGAAHVETVDGDDALHAAADAAPEEAVFVIVGGDGTLHHTVGALHDRGRPFLLLPAGTGNDFANGLGLSEDLLEVAAAAGPGRAQPLDLIRVADQVAVNAVHMGVGVEAAVSAQGLKDRLGKLAYTAGAVAAATRFEPLVITATLDGEQVLERQEVALLGVCNGPLVGGGTALCPEADPRDGTLDLVVLLAGTRAGLAATTADLVRGAHLEREDVVHLRGEALEVEVHDCDGLTVNVDGELQELPAALSCRLDPGAWELLLPEDV